LHVGIDEPLMRAANDLGVSRCAVLAPTDTVGALSSFLHNYATVGGRLDAAST
jgi:hypothetical protein